MGFWSFTACFGSIPLFVHFLEGEAIRIVPGIPLFVLLLVLLERVSYEVKIDAGGATLTWRSPLRRGRIEIGSIDRLYIDRLMGGLAIFRGPRPRLVLMESHSSEFDEFVSALVSLRAGRPFEVIDRRPAERVRTTGFKTYFGPSER